MLNRRLISWPLAAALLTLLPAAGFAQNCGQFTDVPASSVFCPFILQAFISSVTQGTGPTTFSPSDLVPREQMVTFFDRGMDLTIHRATVRTATGKTWAPTSANGGAVTDVGGTITDIVTDATYLWIARSDSKVLKVLAADRRVIETWTIPAGSPRKLGVFAGLVWIADNLGNLFVFNPTNPAGAATPVASNTLVAATNSPTLAFDGTNVWWAGAASTGILIYPVGTQSAGAITSPANVYGMVFDGTYMWVLLANSSVAKLTIPASGSGPSAVESLSIPGAVSDCRMVYDGNNIWIPIGATGTLYVVRPTTSLASLPSSIAKNEAIPDVAFPYVASFDGENVMIGGANNGTVALYKATSLARIRTFATGASGIRGIAADGRSFNVGDSSGTKFFQF